MKHFAVLNVPCRRCEEHGVETKFHLELELSYPAALLGVKITCPNCGRESVWYSRGKARGSWPTPAVGSPPFGERDCRFPQNEPPLPLPRSKS